jgi:hypothetical protein
MPTTTMTKSGRSTDENEQLYNSSALNDTSLGGSSVSNVTETASTTIGVTSTNPISSFFNNVKDQLIDIVDEQRIERLQHCRIIEDVYNECRRFNKLVKQQQQLQLQPSPDTATTLKRTMHLEDFPPGIRILKYYDWRNMHDYDHKCSREKHAVWACRAGALQCGAHLVQLRNCFNSAVTPPPGVVDPISMNNKDYGAVLNVASTAYEPSKLKQSNSNADTIPCREFQENMGLCIATNATALAEREMRRSEKTTTPS